MMRDRQRTMCKQWQYRPFIDVARCHHLRCVCGWKIWWICEKCATIFSGKIILVIVTGEKWIGKKWIGMNGTWHFTYDRTIEIGEYIGVDAWLWFDSFVWFRSWQRLAAHSSLFSNFLVSDLTFVAHSWSKAKTKDENYMRITNINDTRSNLCTLRAAEPSAIPVNNKFYEIINVFYDGYSVSLWFSACGFFSSFFRRCALECFTPPSLIRFCIIWNHYVERCPTALDTCTHSRWKSDLFQLQQKYALRLRSEIPNSFREVAKRMFDSFVAEENAQYLFASVWFNNKNNKNE